MAQSYQRIFSDSRSLSAAALSFIQSSAIAQILIANIVMILAAQIAVPMVPVPMTLQTLAVLFIGMTLTPVRAAIATIIYLSEASLGWPVLSGAMMDPLWMIGPRAGYLLAFPVVAWLVAYCAQSGRFGRVAFAVLAGQAIILVLGAAWLSLFVGFQSAVSVGVFPFVFGEVVKAGLALTAARAYTDF